MYYLKQSTLSCRYETQGAVERFKADKARIASVLNMCENLSVFYHI